EINGNGEFARLLRKDEACKPVSVRILLPIHEVLRRRHLERIAFDARAAMRGGTQANDLRGESNRPVVAVACNMVEAGEDRHTLLCYSKTASILRNFRCNFRSAGPLRGGAPNCLFNQVVDCGEPTARLRPAIMARIALCSESRG